MQYAYYLELPCEFPEGIHFGAGSQFNRLSIARDGTGRLCGTVPVSLVGYARCGETT